jgi:hypothetical protein
MGNFPITNEDFRIRAATHQDADPVAECVAAAYEHYIDRLGRPPGPMKEDYADVLRTRHVFVAEADDSLIGVLVLGMTDEGFLLDNVAVTPPYRR